MELIKNRDANLLMGIITFIRAQNSLPLSASLLQKLLKSCFAGCISIVYDNTRPVGYIAWADISYETLKQIRSRNISPQYQYEWHEGDIRLIIDLVICTSDRKKTTSLLFSMRKTSKFIVFIDRKNKLNFYGSRYKYRRNSL